MYSGFSMKRKNDRDDNLNEYYLFAKSIENEWNSHRELAVDDSNDEELYIYFNKIFCDGFCDHIINAGTKLYRARQIKSNNKEEIGLNDIRCKEKKVFSEEYDNLNEINSLNKRQILSFPEYLLYLTIIEPQNEKLLKKRKEFNAQISDIKFVGYKKEGCGIPPKEFRKDYRLSTSEDEFLYLSFDADTAISEMRPSRLQIYSIAECQVLNDLKVLNLYDSSKYEKNSKIGFSKLTYLLDKISEPNTDDNTAFYKITQKLSHYVKEKGFDGIAYKSSMRNKGINLMLFDSSNVEFINSNIYTIKKINIVSEKYF